MEDVNGMGNNLVVRFSSLFLHIEEQGFDKLSGMADWGTEIEANRGKQTYQASNASTELCSR